MCPLYTLLFIMPTQSSTSEKSSAKGILLHAWRMPLMRSIMHSAISRSLERKNMLTTDQFF